MILLIVWDGLRPDMITAERTPFLHRMAGQGVFCQASHAAYPTSTRVNSASLTTGCYPGRHGIADNGRYLPALNPHKALDFADWRHLQGMADLEHGRLLTAPTLGEILRANGRRMASAGSGSPGTTYLTNPTVTGPVVNWALAWPAEAGREIEQRFGGFLESGFHVRAAQRLCHAGRPRVPGPGAPSRRADPLAHRARSRAARSTGWVRRRPLPRWPNWTASSRN